MDMNRVQVPCVLLYIFFPAVLAYKTRLYYILISDVAVRPTESCDFIFDKKKNIYPRKSL